MPRKLFLWLLTLTAMLAWTQPTDRQPLVSERDVRVERSGNAFIIDLVMHTAVAPALAWVVLTDFEHMGSIVPNLTSSQVIERRDAMLSVKQKGVVRYGLFSTNFESTREISLVPQREIRAHGVGGNVQRMESLMQLEAEGAGTRLTYHAEVLPGFWFPPVLGPALVRHETAEQFSALLREMIRRQ